MPKSITKTGTKKTAALPGEDRSQSASTPALPPHKDEPVMPEASASTTPGSDSWVVLAVLVRPQGREGEILAGIETDFPELFAERRRLYLRAPGWTVGGELREVALEEHWLHKDRLVLKFSGVDSIEAADTLRGFEVVIPRAERAALEDGAVYIADLVGCSLYDRAVEAVAGEIIGVDRESANMDLLVVRTAGGEALVPFANAYEPVIDLAARRMTMRLPEGLLILDAPAGDEARDGIAPAATGKNRKKRKRVGGAKVPGPGAPKGKTTGGDAR